MSAWGATGAWATQVSGRAPTTSRRPSRGGPSHPRHPPPPRLWSHGTKESSDILSLLNCGRCLVGNLRRRRWRCRKAPVEGRATGRTRSSPGPVGRRLKARGVDRAAIDRRVTAGVDARPTAAATAACFALPAFFSRRFGFFFWFFQNVTRGVARVVCLGAPALVFLVRKRANTRALARQHAGARPRSSHACSFW